MPIYWSYRRQTGEWADAGPPERWRCEAHYTDGTALLQFDPSEHKNPDGGRYHRFEEIQQEKLSHFCMINDDCPPLILQWVPGRKLIHFYSNYIATPLGGGGEMRRERLYCFGYEESYRYTSLHGGDAVHKSKVIIVIMPDDGIVITDDQNKVTLEF